MTTFARDNSKALRALAYRCKRNHRPLYIIVFVPNDLIGYAQQTHHAYVQHANRKGVYLRGHRIILWGRVLYMEMMQQRGKHCCITVME